MIQKLKVWFYRTFPQFMPNPHNEALVTPKPNITDIPVPFEDDVVTKIYVDEQFKSTKQKELEERIEKSLAEGLKREKETGIRVGDPFITTSGPVEPKSGEHRYNHAKTKEGYGVCRCGTRENTDESLLPCTAPKPKNRRKNRGRKGKNRRNKRKNKQNKG